MHPDIPTRAELEALEPYAPQYCGGCGKMRIIPRDQRQCVVCLGLVAPRKND